MDNSQFVTATLAEFISVWNHGGEVFLNLSTNKGSINISFNLRLGQPGTPFSSSPSSTHSSRPRHCDPAQKDRDRKRAAKYEAAQATVAQVTTELVETSPPVDTSPSVIAEQVASSMWNKVS